MIPVHSAVATASTEFRDARAVETWDAFFRWREDGVLRDVTIDDTWARVARALTQNEARAAAYRDAFSRWRLLPDARLLRYAGTATPPHLVGRIDAVVNVAAFVARRSFDHTAFAQVAALAKSLVNDAGAFCASGVPLAPSIGLIGFEEARIDLGLAAGSRETGEFAMRIAATLAAHAGRGATALTPQPLLARFANHVHDGFDGSDRIALVEAVKPWLPQR
jgi:hypothetical protein